jgi:hypothetical protein
MLNQYAVRTIYRNARPRNKQYLEGINGGGGVGGSGTGTDFMAQYWFLGETPEAEDPEEEAQPLFIKTSYDTVVDKIDGYFQAGTKRFQEDSIRNAILFSNADGTAAHFLSTGDVAACVDADWEDIAPLAGYNAPGFASFDDEFFSVIDGHVSLVGGVGGKEYFPGTGLSLSGTNSDTFNVRYGSVAGTAAAGNDSRINNGQSAYNLLNGSGSWWGQTMSGGSVSGAMSGVTNINSQLYFYNNNLGVGVSAPSQKLYVSGNIFSTQDVVAAAGGNYDVTSPLAGYNAVGLARFNSADFTVSNGYVSLLNPGGGGTVTWDSITGKPSWITDSKPPYAWSEITNKPSWVTTSTPIASASSYGMIRVGSGLSISNGILSATGGGSAGAISEVLYYANSSSSYSSYTSGIRLKVGYKVMPTNTTLAGGAYTNLALWEISYSDSVTLSVVACVETPSGSWNGSQLTCAIGKSDSDGVYFARLYNPTSTAVSLSNMRIRYIAVQRI